MNSNDQEKKGGFKDGVLIEKLSSWEEFTDAINRFPNYNEYIFRGQRKAEWKLESSLNRHFKKTQPTCDYKIRDGHLEHFKRATRGRRGSNPRTITEENEWWALGQQHGLVTPLLDWTEAPYVALFFAFIEPAPVKDQGDRAVYALHEGWIKKRKDRRETEYQLSTKQFGELPPLEESGVLAQLTDRPRMADVVRLYSDENRNLVSQRGLFTYCPFGEALDDWVKREFKGEMQKIILTKIVIPDNERDKCLQTLNKMNINHLTLFPDLYGASKYCNLNLQIDNY